MFFSRQFVVLVVAAMTLASPTALTPAECVTSIASETGDLLKQCNGLAMNSSTAQVLALQTAANNIETTLTGCSVFSPLTDAQCTAQLAQLTQQFASVFPASCQCIVDKKPVFDKIGTTAVARFDLTKIGEGVQTYFGGFADSCSNAATKAKILATADQAKAVIAKALEAYP
ncbi:hypothetical protein C8R46DRAFT_483598 [Mycena filopes]|nr:hypothetical protein C8R46DRAFT_483598 [Mycena filopes]